MSHFGLDRPRSPLYYTAWKIAVVFGLLLTCGLFYYAAASVHYDWRWYRVPQYFWYSGQEDIRSDFSGTIKEVQRTANGTVIRFAAEDHPGELVTMTLGAGAETLVQPESDVYMGDIIAKRSFSKPGILLDGLWVTVVVSSFAILAGIGIGLVTGLCRLSNNPALRWGAITYIEIIRGSPLLVQIFLWYFVVGFVVDALLGQLGLPGIAPLWYGVAALAIFTGAYVAEIVRAGIQSVHRGQMEAARSLGMTHSQAMRKIILPQAFRRILPPLAGQFISLIKDSSLLGVMGVRELTKATREAVTSSLQSLELWFTCALLYLVLTFMLSLFVQYLEKRAVR